MSPAAHRPVEQGPDYFQEGYTAHRARKSANAAGCRRKSCRDQRRHAADAGGGERPDRRGAGQGAHRGIAAIEKQGCGDDPKFRCQVVDLYHGGQFKLYKYRKYSDVRLVFSPGFQAAFFGGDPDNFNFPRYDLDSAFVRLYEDGKPVATSDHLKWNASAPSAGEPVFVAGNPGGTDRQLTIAQLESQRDLQSR